MNLRESNYSRPIQKPKPEDLNYVLNLDSLEEDVHAKIDYLRKKIIVTRKREKVIKEESTELTANTAAELIILIRQNDQMKSDLSEALYAEQDTVKNALRTHPIFQMAMSGKGGEECINWLEDKIFDLAKVINGLYCKMCAQQSKMDEVEDMVGILEKFPRPGSSPYEIELQERLSRVRLEIELSMYKRTTAAVLLKKYKEVKEDITRENITYEIILKQMENKIEELFGEKKVMDHILAVAQKFQAQKLKDLSDYERAYNTNYKIRKNQLRKKRKQTEAKLESEERNAVQESRRIQAEQAKMNEQADPKKDQLMNEKQARLRDRIDAYRTKLGRVQEVMRVENVNKVIQRMRHMVWLTNRLEKEAMLKAQLNVLLEKQRSNLLMIKCHMTYSGFVEHNDYVEKKSQLLQERQQIEQEIELVHEKMNRLNEINEEATIDIFLLLRKLGDKSKFDKSFKQRFRIMTNLMESLKEDLINAREEVSDATKSRKPFLKLLRSVRPEKRLVRVGTPPNDEGENDIDDEAQDALANRYVPGRAQIKERSERFLKRILIKKGGPY